MRAVAPYLLTIAIIAMPCSAIAHGGTKTPVRVGGNGPEIDACRSNGGVTGLNANGDNFLSVRAAPSPTAREVGRLRQDQGVFVCDYAAGGQWVGIVWGAPDSGCGLHPGSPKRNYAGPCRSGWVSRRFLLVTID